MKRKMLKSVKRGQGRMILASLFDVFSKYV
ncbi:hypothetical protein BH20ACT12_BH20ACT12_11240 [soil metagenome]